MLTVLRLWMIGAVLVVIGGAFAGLAMHGGWNLGLRAAWWLLCAGNVISGAVLMAWFCARLVLVMEQDRRRRDEPVSALETNAAAKGARKPGRQPVCRQLAWEAWCAKHGQHGRFRALVGHRVGTD